VSVIRFITHALHLPCNIATSAKPAAALVSGKTTPGRCGQGCDKNDLPAQGETIADCTGKWLQYFLPVSCRLYRKWPLKEVYVGKALNSGTINCSCYDKIFCAFTAGIYAFNHCTGPNRFGQRITCPRCLQLPEQF
jgi:hypothetical protein